MHGLTFMSLNEALYFYQLGQTRSGSEGRYFRQEKGMLRRKQS